VDFTVRISYLEIYNNAGYDLLHPDHETKGLEDLPRVHCMEDDDGVFQLTNMSSPIANSEEDALNLLFLGDTNRMIAETPMNMASSRSHCIFTINIESRVQGSATVKKSKLNLVDLAGSERVGKTGVKDKLLTEAVAINSALFYLEQVIVALGERSNGKRSHIPYRNSMMTSCLRDSLGGNCKTSMVATIASEKDALEESMATCRFAQRVAMVSNEVRVNEEVDPHVMIKRLKKENEELRAQIAMLEGEMGDGGTVTPEERDRVLELVKAFLSSEDEDAQLMVGDLPKIQCAFSILKSMVGEGGGGGGGGSVKEVPSPAPTGGVSAEQAAVNDERIRRLQLQVTQRDNEINILVGMLKKKKPPTEEVQTQTGAKETSTTAGHAMEAGSWTPGKHQGPEVERKRALMREQADAEAAGRQVETTVEQMEDMELLKDRNKSFEAFRKSYKRNEVIETQKKTLRDKYASAKATGEVVNAARAKINSLKAKIEQRRVERAMQAVSNGGSSEEGEDPEEAEARREMEAQKEKYKTNFDELKKFKGEIEHIQHLLESSRVRLQKDFEQWFECKVGGVKQEIAHDRMEARAEARREAKDLAMSGKHMQAASLPTHTLGASTTGNAEADADIAAFYAAREQLLKSKGR